MQHKICSTCKTLLSLDNFHKEKHGFLGVRGRCKLCTKKSRGEYLSKNRLRINERSKAWRLKNPDKVKKYQSQGFLARKFAAIKRNYGVSRDQYIDMLEKQDGRCIICDTRSSKMCIDHCHNTGKVRGLLCDKCNRGLGFFKENVEVLRRAADFLEGKIATKAD